MSAEVRIPIGRRALAEAFAEAIRQNSIPVFSYPAEYIPKGAMVMIAGEPALWHGTSPDQPSKWRVDFLLAPEHQDLSKGAFATIQRVCPSRSDLAEIMLQGMTENPGSKITAILKYAKRRPPRFALTVAVAEVCPGDCLDFNGNAVEVSGIDSEGEAGAVLRLWHAGTATKHILRLPWREYIDIRRTARDI